MAISLAEKLGSKGLLSFSLHPGVIFTNLGTHLENFDSLSAFNRLPRLSQIGVAD